MALKVTYLWNIVAKLVKLKKNFFFRENPSTTYYFLGVVPGTHFPKFDGSIPSNDAIRDSSYYFIYNTVKPNFGLLSIPNILLYLPVMLFATTVEMKY